MQYQEVDGLHVCECLDRSSCPAQCTNLTIVAPPNGTLGNCPSAGGTLESGEECWATCHGSNSGPMKLPFVCSGDGALLNSTECCGPGTGLTEMGHGPITSVNCTACIPGTYDDDIDPSTPCVVCAAGTYSNA
eukprot:COSAG02_NODE_24105_length_697_cov_1.745819_1_plen_132_part_10